MRPIASTKRMPGLAFHVILGLLFLGLFCASFFGEDLTDAMRVVISLLIKTILLAIMNKMIVAGKKAMLSERAG